MFTVIAIGHMSNALDDISVVGQLLRITLPRDEMTSCPHGISLAEAVISINSILLANKNDWSD